MIILFGDEIKSVIVILYKALNLTVLEMPLSFSGEQNYHQQNLLQKWTKPPLLNGNLSLVLGFSC